MLCEPALDDAVREQLRDACDELERRLRAGQRCRAEEFFQSVPALASHTELALDLLYTEFLVRTELRQQALAEEFFKRFPLWRRSLEHQFQFHQWLRDSLAEVAFSHAQESAPTAPDHNSAGYLADDAVPGYQLVRELARGAMGVVHEARHLDSGRLVALKMIHGGPQPDAHALARFRIEAEVVARLQHPNIVRLYEVGEHCTGPYLAMEYVHGGTLAARLVDGPLAPREAARLIEPLARAIHHAHQRGVAHCDLKPANILLTADGTPKIVDFGLAKLLTGLSAPPAGGFVLCGTPCYMAPEQVEARPCAVGPLTDVYGLGAILYEALTGQPPFRARTALQTLRQVLQQPVESPRRFCRELPPDLEIICLKCLEKDAADRYGSSGELADDLRRFLDDRPILAERVTRCDENGGARAPHAPLVFRLAPEPCGLAGRVQVGNQAPAGEASGNCDQPEAVCFVAFSPDGRQAASAGFDQTIRVWDVVSGQPIQVLRSPGGPVEGMGYTADGQQLAALKADGIVRLWDVADVHENARFATSNDAIVRLWDGRS